MKLGRLLRDPGRSASNARGFTMRFGVAKTSSLRKVNGADCHEICAGLEVCAVPGGEEKLSGKQLVGVAGGQVPRDLRAFLDVPADRDRGRRRAGPVGLLEAVIAAVEARDYAGAAIA